jgi:hypothetical protein
MTAVDEVQMNRKTSATAKKEFNRLATQKACEYRSLLKLFETSAVFGPMVSASAHHFRNHKSLFRQ